ncbi:MAG: spore cortex biosynthesis protein YabQ [Clostridia bacterium]|jgi:spore cortex biosynthesis protein YabQ|nr:spore cortex biosynthesis protein YabQ [Clostridia bacterium]
MVTNQAYLFIIFTINGIIIGILFDIFRILRRSFKTTDIITYVQDILFWILTGFILLYSIFTFSNGEIRFYMFLGVFLGCLIYMLMFSKYFIKVNVKIVIAIKEIIMKLISILLLPIKIVINLLKKIFFKPIKFITININKISLKSKKSNTQS